MSRVVDMTEALHDRYIAAAATFRAEPTRARAQAAATAYERFYLAFAGRGGLEDALAELNRKMADTMAQRGVA